jgi:c(7)-type cytochrome triheme protein
MTLRWTLLGGGVATLLAACALLACARGGAAPVTQPIAFSHRTHVQGEEMECTDCHRADTDVRAGFADIRDCYECHKTPQGEPPHADEEKVRAHGKARTQLPWVKVNRNPGHVYFSHRAHVAFGRMKCEECHGDMSALQEPVTRPTKALHSMDRCIACHREKGASLECASCHD